MHSAGLERATAVCEATTLPMRPLRVSLRVVHHTEGGIRVLQLTYGRGGSTSYRGRYSCIAAITYGKGVVHHTEGGIRVLTMIPGGYSDHSFLILLHIQTFLWQ